MLKDVFACLDEREVPITPQEKEFRVLILRPQALIVSLRIQNMLDEKPLGEGFEAIIEHLEANKELMSDDLRRFYRSIAKCSMIFDRK
jgi:hypothetical protein